MSNFWRSLRWWWKGILSIILVIAVVHGTATYVMGRRLEQAIAAVRAQGDPVSPAELAEPRIRDAENGASDYMQAFKIMRRNIADLYQKIKAERPRANPPAGSVSAVRVLTDLERLSSVESMRLDRMDARAWELAGALVASDEPAVRLIEQAQSKPGCRFYANWQDGSGALFPYLAQVREATRCLGMRAILHARDGRMDDAIHDLEMSAGMADTIKDDRTLIHQLVRFAVVAITNRSVQAVNRQYPLDAAQCTRLSSALSRLEFDRSYLQSMKGEQAMTMSIFTAIAQGRSGVSWILGSETPSARFIDRLLPSYAWRPFLYADELATIRLYRREGEIAALPYRETGTSGLSRDMDAKIANLPRYCIVTGMGMPVFARATAQRDATAATVRGCGIYLGLMAYKDRFGSYPQSLNELRSRLGWKVQEDPLSGKAFVYSRVGDGFLVYSIGVNLRDDNGLYDRSTRDRHDGGLDDIAWRDPASEQRLQAADRRSRR